MTSPGGYVLDANVFIEAHRRYYTFDICPGYWAALLTHHKSGRIGSIERVGDELLGQGDALAQWAQALPRSFFAVTGDPSVAGEFGGIMTWVYAQTQYFDPAKAAFAAGADGWLVAYARVHGLTVVTQEGSSPAVRNRVPIPNVCVAFGVHWINTFAMLRALGVAFR
jgi:hypothetical protein